MIHPRDDDTPPIGVSLRPPGPASVLVVDDDRDLAHFLAEALASEGHRVRLARSAAETDEFLIEAEPDLVVMDLILEDADGAEVARRIRRDYPEVQIVFLTGLPRRGAQVAHEFSAPLVTKPFRLEQLTSAIRIALAVRV